MSTHKISQPIRHKNAPRPVQNTTDATRGEPIAERARTRKAELEKALALLPATRQRARADIDLALAEVNQWLAGGVEHLSHVTAAELSRWLEATKHLAEVAAKAPRSRS
jgi:hypothetical protein